MENHASWIKADELLPEKGVQVLVWNHDGPAGFGIASIGEHGGWTSQAGGGTPPAYWMYLPQPPGAGFSRVGGGISGDVAGGRLMLDIDEEPEAVARMMQHYIDGSAAVVSDSAYFVTDMKNEVVGGKMVSVFFLTPRV